MKKIFRCFLVCVYVWIKKNFFHFLVSCEHLSHGHFFPTYIDLYSWSYFVYTFLRVTIYSLNYLVSHCHNVCIFSDSLYRIFCFVLFLFFIFSFEWCADLVIILYLRKWVSARNHTKNQKEKKHTHSNRLYCLRVFVWREK